MHILTTKEGRLSLNSLLNIMEKNKILFLPILAFFSLHPLPASAWGAVGHEVVAYIAQDNLTTVTKQKISDLLIDSGMESAQANPASRFEG